MKYKYDTKCMLVLFCLFTTGRALANDEANFRENWSENKLSTHVGLHYENEKDSLETDIKLLSQETGYPIEKTRMVIQFQKNFRRYAQKLIKTYPTKIAAIYISKFPETQGYVRFVGTMPNNIYSSSLGKLENKIKFNGGERYSLKDNHKRSIELSKSLSELGYNNTVTFFNQRKNKLQIEMKLDYDSKLPVKQSLIKSLQTQFSKSNLKKELKYLGNKELDIKIIRGKGKIVTENFSRGGSRLRSDGIDRCTMGWSATHSNGVTGILTAGHCTGLNQLQDHNNQRVYSMVFENQVYGRDGDVEFRTTPLSAELDDFHADSSTIRDVSGIQNVDGMVGNSVCLYGRSSNVRTCNNTVTETGVTVMSNGNTRVGNLVRTDNTSSVPGDSGGGWSWGTTAWGIDHGDDPDGNGYFMPVQIAENLLDVTIMR